MKSISIDIEFDDLDAGGVVYHPNYIRLCERARNRWLGEYGITFTGLKKIDVALAIRTIRADYLKPLFHESVCVTMKITRYSKRSFTILHTITPELASKQYPYFSAEITLVSANYSTGHSCTLPSEVHNFVLNNYIENIS